MRKERKALVYRDGIINTVSTNDLLVGDLI